MSKLKMEPWREMYYSVPDGYSVFRVGSEDLSDFPFPIDERVVELWNETVPEVGELRVLMREDEPINNIIVSVPKGTRKKKRQPFLDALERECGQV